MMNQVDLIKKIGNILTELQDQQQYAAENQQQLNMLELEFFLSNANFLTDQIHLLMKVIGQHEVREIAAPKVSKAETEPATFEFVLKEESSVHKFDFEEKKVEEIFNRPLSEEEQQIIARKKLQNAAPQYIAPAAPEGEEIGPEPFLVKPIEEPKIEEQPQIIDTSHIEEAHVIKAVPVVISSEPIAVPITESSAKPTLNEMFGGGLNANRTEEPKAEISDLRQAISLNDKLLYVKDMFHGYSLAYSEVIELLNKMPDYQSAYAFLQKNYAVQNNWSDKPETVERFYELLKRRFPAK